MFLTSGINNHLVIALNAKAGLYEGLILPEPR
jgi:hypothetical protein